MERSVLPEYEDDMEGVNVRVLNAVVRERCANCGDETEAYHIPDEEGLAAAVAVARVLLPLHGSALGSRSPNGATLSSSLSTLTVPSQRF